MSTVKLTSYNTSVLNDMNDKHLFPYLSESASFMAKFVKLYPDEKDTYDKLRETLNTASDNIKDANNKDNLTGMSANSLVINGPTLKKMRDEFDNKNAEYIGNQLKVEGSHVISLMEQTIHVPRNSHANYDILKEKNNINTYFDLGEDNNKYGILRKITNIKTSYSNDSKEFDNKFTIEYDNVMNVPAKVGEGIAIIYSKNLIDKPLEWDYKENPNVKRVLKAVAEKDEKYNIDTFIKDKTYKTKNLNDNFNVNYYSDDLGPMICGGDTLDSAEYVTNSNPPRIDNGRPCIMTAGYKGDDTLVVMIAFHGPNFPKLKPNTNTKEDKNKDAILAERMYTTLQNFVNSGLDGKEKKEKILVFIGCDSNDTQGMLFEHLVNGGLEIANKQVHFKGNDENVKKDNLNDIKYKACCANCDSSYSDKKPDKCNGLGPMNSQRLDDVENAQVYYPEFYNPKYFKNLGDYALFGSSEQNDFSEKNSNTNYKRVELYFNEEKNITPSDHLPVENTITISDNKNTQINKTDKNKNTENLNEQKKLVLNDFIISLPDMQKFIKKYSSDKNVKISDDNGNLINKTLFTKYKDEYINHIIDKNYKDLNINDKKEKLTSLYNNMNSIKMKGMEFNGDIERATNNNSITDSLKAINEEIKSTQKQGGKRRTRRRSRRSRRSTHRKKKMSRRKRNTRKRR